MFSRSISATLASPTAQATQRALIVAASSARSSGRTCLESLRPREVERAVEDDHGGDDRTGQRTAPDLVGAADEAVPVGPGGIFVAMQADQPPLFALARVAPFARRVVHAGLRRIFEGDAAELALAERAQVGAGGVVRVDRVAAPHEAARARKALEIRHVELGDVDCGPRGKTPDDVFGIVAFARQRAGQRQHPLGLGGRESSERECRVCP